MAVLLPATAWVKTIDTGETVQCGSITLPTSTELTYLRVLLFIYGTIGGTEQMRVKIYSDSAYSKVLYTGSWVSLSDISNLSQYWWGWIALPVNRGHLKASATYYVGVESQNYTRSGDTYYLSLSLDGPVKEISSNPYFAVKMQVYGYREITHVN